MVSCRFARGTIGTAQSDTARVAFCNRITQVVTHWPRVQLSARTSQKTSFSRLMTASGSDAGASSWKRDSSTNRTDASCRREMGEREGRPSGFPVAASK